MIGLDTRGSMQGLIGAARQKPWSVVNEIATPKPEPRLRVALLTYGTPGKGKPGDVVIQARTRELSVERTAYVKQVMDRQGLDDSLSLDKALRTTVREQADERVHAK